MSLFGQTVLVVEDEPLIAHDIAQTFEQVGARVVVARSLQAALKAVATNTFSAAILDGMTGDAELHQRLSKAGVPYMVYSGYAPAAEAAGPHLDKPASREALLTAIKALLDAPAGSPLCGNSSHDRE